MIIRKLGIDYSGTNQIVVAYGVGTPVALFAATIWFAPDYTVTQTATSTGSVTEAFIGKPLRRSRNGHDLEPPVPEPVEGAVFIAVAM